VAHALVGNGNRTTRGSALASPGGLLSLVDVSVNCTSGNPPRPNGNLESTHVSGSLRSGLRAQKLRGTAVSFACFLNLGFRGTGVGRGSRAPRGHPKMGCLPRVWIPEPS